MSDWKKFGRRVFLGAPALALVGCTALSSPAAAPAEEQPTANLDAVRTEAAQTVIAGLTVEAALNPSSTPLPSNTALPAFTSTSEQAPAVVPSVTIQAVIPTATKKPAGGGGGVVYPTRTRTPYTDAAELVYQNPADGTVMPTGNDFDIIWTVKNVGLRPWNTDFYIRYLSGEKGAKGTLYMLGTPINVGETYDFRVDMIAPYSPGDYRSTWQLVNDDNTVILTLFLAFTVQ